MKISLGQKILSRNEECAQKNRQFFHEHKILCLNVISSPGAGKTSLLVRTIQELRDRLRIGVIEGDIETDHDARRIQAAGAAAFQIETKGACHLSAEQVHNALKRIDAENKDLIFIENVGNLVCPSAFDLGETARVVILSVPEGDDKPAKYPGTFAGASVVLLNKIDLLPHVPFQIQRVLADLHTVNPNAAVFQVSAATGEGMKDWYDWLRRHLEKNRP
jgi:hydrogenase nickel incorporation protein HypB